MCGVQPVPDLSVSISFMHAEFLFAICKMGKQNCTLRACSQAQMKSCAMLGSEGFKQYLMVPSCTDCDEKQSPERQNEQSLWQLWKGRRAALVLTDHWGPRRQAPGSIQLGLAGMPQHAQAG